jgi:hypothetical protein
MTLRQSRAGRNVGRGQRLLEEKNTGRDDYSRVGVEALDTSTFLPIKRAPRSDSFFLFRSVMRAVMRSIWDRSLGMWGRGFT